MTLQQHKDLGIALHTCILQAVFLKSYVFTLCLRHHLLCPPESGDAAGWRQGSTASGDSVAYSADPPAGELLDHFCAAAISGSAVSGSSTI